MSKVIEKVEKVSISERVSSLVEELSKIQNELKVLELRSNLEGIPSVSLETNQNNKENK